MMKCEVCGVEVVQGRGPARRTCSAACRQKAHRRRQAAEMERLRDLAVQPVLAPSERAPATPASASRNEPPPLGEDGGAELPASLRPLWLDLAEAVSIAASRATSRWDSSEVLAGVARATAEDVAFMIRHRADKLAVAILAEAQSSRNEPAEPAEPAVAPDAAPVAGSSRNGPAESRTLSPVAVRRPRRMSAEQANAVAAGATLVSRDRDTYSWDVVAADGSILGHVEPAYQAGRRKGWQGWATQLTRSSDPRRHPTRDAAGADALGQWIRIVTAKPRR